MRKRRLGFTLIEVAIFLAITGALFVGISVGVQNSISQQRYNDAVQNFMEFLRTTYASVSNVQSIGNGRSEKAIYGKMMTFGEDYDFTGEEIEGQKNKIFSYTVIGDVGKSESGKALQLLSDLNANVVTKDAEGEFQTAGLAESYTPKWSAQIEKPCEEDKCEYVPFTGTLLIVRHPSSGTIYTFYKKDVIQVNEMIAKSSGADSLDVFKGKEGGEEVDYLANGSFELSQVDFCVNQDPGMAVLRGDVRIMKGARNASGVEIIPEEIGVCQVN